MKIRSISWLALAGILAVPLAAQTLEGYLDVDIATVKAGKRAAFDAASKRIVELNRRNKGDTWLAYEAMYGGSGTVYFTAVRPSYKGVEDGAKTFMGALTKGVGAAGMQRLFDEWGATVENDHAELRHRRMDLTANPPADTAVYFRTVGQSRFLRTATVHVRPGRIPDYEAQLKVNKPAMEKANPTLTAFVSQGVAGQETGVFYTTYLLRSLGDLDEIKGLAEALGAGYPAYLKTVSETVSRTDILIGRILPELSNPPDEVVAVDEKFWRPAPPPRPKASEDKKEEKK